MMILMMMMKNANLNLKYFFNFLIIKYNNKLILNIIYLLLIYMKLI